MIIFIFSMYDMLKTQIWYFSKVAETQFFCTTTCQQAHWTRWQVKFCSEGNLPTMTKLEATPRDRIDSRISGQPEEPFFFFLNERQAKEFLISSLLKQVVKSPNKSTMINDLIKNLGEECSKSRLQPCMASRFRNSCFTKLQPGTT